MFGIFCFFVIFIFSTGCQKKEERPEESKAFSMEILETEQDLEQIMAVCCSGGRLYLIGKQGEECWFGSMELNGQEQKWEPISGLEGEILSIASDGHGTFQLLMETFLRDKKQWKLIQAQYQEGNGNITAKQPLRTEKNSSMVEGMDMEHTVVSYDMKKYYVYGEGCAEDGTEISCALADALFVLYGA